MRSSILPSVALSLAGLRAVGASVCKPRSLSSGVSTVASMTLIAPETTFSGSASESFVLSSTIASASAEVTTGVDSTGIDITTELALTTEVTTTVAIIFTDDSTIDTATTEAPSSTVVSASTEATYTADSTIATQTTASNELTASSETTSVTDTTTAPFSSDTTTTTEATTTTTAELPVITDFQLKGTRAPVDGTSIYSNRAKGNYLLFSAGIGYSPATFRVEATSGHLLVDNSLPVCAFFQPGQDLATLILCSDPLESREVAITCTRPAKDGDVLSCSVPAQTCVQTQINFFEYSYTCTPTGEMLTDTSTNFNYDLNQNIPVIGQITNGVTFAVHAV
ncbi:activator of stress 1 [Fusarium beomiforme]|uniref:Activator of stress 1 n=1 Tax=Fusarium beomiforme TaxID=44412 RepID=A0A9P5ADA0_9HYPO|nr:activator of stress 1 [Fusarium beomiforme]